MTRNFLIVLLLAGIIWCVGGGALAAPVEGLLVDQAGNELAGYSAVIIDNGLAYPVRNLESGQWYSVTIVGTSAEGAVLCRVGEVLAPIPEGVAVDESESNEEEVDEGTDR